MHNPNLCSECIPIGTVTHKLTSLGREQAKGAASELRDLLRSDFDYDNNLIVISSDFTRAKETAENCVDALSKLIDVSRIPPILVRPELRER